MPSGTTNNLESDRKLRAFVQDVRAALLDGNRHQTGGLGTFSTCARKATPDRPACRMAMFRACAELREFANGGQPPHVTGPHADAVAAIINAMCNENGIEVPDLGRMAVVPAAGKNPKLIFHGADTLNQALSDT